MAKLLRPISILLIFCLLVINMSVIAQAADDRAQGKADGEKDAKAEIESNDPDESVFDIGLEGTSLENTSRLKWKFETGGLVRPCPAIGSNGTIYIVSYDKYLYAINSNKTEKWKFEIGISAISSPAIGSDGTIYVGSYDTHLYAINPSDGSQKWKFKTEGWIYSSPAIGSDKTVYIGSYDTHLYAINPSDGSQKWKFKTGDLIYSSPAISSDGIIYIGSKDTYLYAINSADGSQKWKSKTGGSVSSSPAIGSDGTIYVGSKDTHLYAINPSDGSQKWKFKTGGMIDSSPAIGSDGIIYVGSNDTHLYAINPSDGSQKWKFKTGGVIGSSPAIGSDGIIYVGSLDTYLYAIDPSDGSQRWKFKTEGWIDSPPAIGFDGTIYFGSRDKCFYAIHSNSNGLANTPWPKFHHNNQNTGSIQEQASPIPNVSITPQSQDFGNVYVGSSADKTFTVTNTGDGTLNVNNTSITGTDASEFTITDGNGSFSLEKDEIHEITVQFSPESEGSKTAKLTIESNDPDEPILNITLDGTGISPNISVVTSPQTTGETFTVDIQVQSITDLFGVSFELTYNATYLTATEVTYEDNILNGELVTIDDIDDSNGIVSIGVNQQSGTAGVNGTGNVAHVSFTSTAEVESFSESVDFSIQDILAIDSNADEITMNAESASVTLEGVPAPDVTSIDPTFGSTDGDTSVTITGTNFQDGATVTIGGADATNVDFVDSTQLTATTPSGSAGTADVVVTNPDEQSGTLSDGFEYLTPPSISTISPTKGSTGGSTSVTITGTDFQSGATVTFGGTSATDVSFNSSTELIATTPEKTGTTPINATVKVTNPNEQYDELDTPQFQFLTPVYPGDTNNDGIVNQDDVAPLGTYWHETGAARTDASIPWSEQLAEDWSTPEATYADATGDGEVDQADVLPIGYNWGETTPSYSPSQTQVLIASENPALPSMKLIVPSEIKRGEKFTVQLRLEEKQIPLEDLFGVAFRLKWNYPEFVQATDVVTDSLLGDDLVSYRRIDENEGQVSVGVSRKRGQESVRGSVTVAEIGFKISPNAPSGEKVTLSFTALRANEPDNESIKVSAGTAEFTIMSSVIIPVEIALREYNDQESPISFQLCRDGEIVQTVTQTLSFTDDADNAISDVTNVKFLAEDGTYELAVKQWHRLQEVVHGIKLPLPEGKIVKFKLDRVGDANNDNYINFDDFTIFAKFYGSLYTREAKYLPSEGSVYTNWNGDFNADSFVNFDDFPAFVESYGTHGEEIGVQSAPMFAHSQDDGINATTSIELIPSTEGAAIGKEIEVKLHAKNASDLYSFTVELDYDRSGLELIGSPAEGKFMEGKTLFTPINGDQDEPITIFGGVTGERKGVSGEGSVATLRFRILNETAGTISLKQSFICDSHRQFNTLQSQELTVRAIPESCVILPNYPNPFNPETWIPYQITQDAEVTVQIYNLAGQLVRKIELGRQSAGYYMSKDRAAYWNGRNQFGETVGSGLYFYTIKAGDFVSTRKMVLMK